MPAPGILTGGNGVSTLFTQGDSTPQSLRGVFGVNPGSTSKSALNSVNSPGRDAEYRETMARLFVEVPGDMTRLLATVSAEAAPLMRVLATGGATGGSGGTGFIDFLLTNANEQFAEKAQIVDTLTDNYVAFYAGQQPPAFTYSGTVLNTYQDDQRVWLLRLYREILRGTRLAGRNLIARLRYDSFIVSGYLESLSMSIDGATEHTAGNFQFSMRVQRMSVFTPSLALPTYVETAAVDSSLLTAPPSAADPDTQRIATVTPEVPPTAITGPAAEPSPGSDPLAESTTTLRELGFTDAEIAEAQALYAEAQAEAAALDTDPREAAVTADSQGLDRLTPEQAARKLNELSLSQTIASGPRPDINPGNVSQDGAGGTTNIYGQLREAIEQDQASRASLLQAQHRSGPRTRGQFLAAAPGDFLL